MSITIRALDPPDWELYKEIRLYALQTEPTVFSSNYLKESAYDDDVWQQHLNGQGQRRRIFGLFDGSAIIGLTGIVIRDDDPAGCTAHLIMSFIRPAYRGRSLSRLLYQARIDWAVAQPQLQTITVSHRAGNEASRRANQSFGFILTHKDEIKWPDDKIDEQWNYALSLFPLRQNATH